MSVEVWLVRHGRTAWNAAGRLQGWTDVPLDDVGRAEARALAPQLADLTFDSVRSSDLRRAVETARLAIGEPEIDARLRERGFGEVEGKRWDELAPATQQRLTEGGTAPGGESIADLARRVTEALDDLGPGRHAVVTHGGVARLVLAACGVDRSLGNAEVARVDWARRRAAPIAT